MLLASVLEVSVWKIILFDFIHLLTCIVRLFMLPLCVQDSKTWISWISSVPSGITRLFDWLEDILNLHM
ncbi:hypothetical protein ARMGADRAFT_945292 [Armillaria gallica]|uniref:Uncharacterized protein n=1 Tax=Armillaria gallica TaxID=47427 RepID=A0A2H3CVK6_ARMGA|nr:hypothetical protein ARMGADRAFT_945292 [Armillaria gallica]